MHGSNSNLCWFLRRGENRGAWRKTLGARTRTNIKLNPHLTTGLRIEPGWWWEASALTTGAIPASPKNPWSKARTNAKLNPQGRNRTQTAMVRGERHCAISGFTRILREPLSPYVERLRVTQFFARYFSNEETNFSLRLVFTSDGSVIRSVERYDLVKIKPTESEAKH